MGRPFTVIYDANHLPVSVDWGELDPEMAGVNYGNERPISGSSSGLFGFLGSLQQNKPQDSGATEQKLTPDQGALVWNTLELARKALISTSCRKYVGEGAYAAMGELWDKGRYTYFHGLQGRKDGGPAWASHGPGPGLFRRFRTGLFYPFLDDATIKDPNVNGATSLGIALRRAADATLAWDSPTTLELTTLIRATGFKATGRDCSRFW